MKKKTAPAKPTLLYFGNFELPDKNAASFRVRGNARIFRDLGLRVVLVGKSKRLSEGNKLSETDSGEEDIEAFEANYPSTNYEWARHMLTAHIATSIKRKLSLKKIAISICYNHPAISQLAIARITRSLQGKAVTDCTEWYSSATGWSLRDIAKNIDTPLRMHYANRKMDGIITTSPFITRFYRNCNVPIVELPTIQSPPPAYPPAQTRTRPIRLFFAGTGLDPDVALKRKEGLKDRLDIAIELLSVAYRGGCKFSFDVFGTTKSDYLKIMPAHARLLAELGHYVTFHGKVPHCELISHLQAADFSIFFRDKTRVTRSGFPGKFSESIAYGTPVITNPQLSINKYMLQGSNGCLINIISREDGAIQLKQCLQMPPERIDAMKKYCRETAMFTHATYVDPVRNWLKEVIETKAR